MVRHSSALRELDLSSNKILAEGAMRIASALTRNDSVTALRLGGCGLGGTHRRAGGWSADSRGVVMLARMLRHNRRLTSLDLSGNQLLGLVYTEDAPDAAGFLTLVRALDPNPDPHPDAGREAGGAGASASGTASAADAEDIYDCANMERAGRPNQTLTSLDLSSNALSGPAHAPIDAPARALLAMLSRNAVLSHVCLAHNRLACFNDQRLTAGLGRVLRASRSLAKLDLTNAGVAGADLAHLSRGLHAAHVDGNVERTLVLRDNPDITSRHRADLKQSLGRTVELEGDSDDDQYVHE